MGLSRRYLSRHTTTVLFDPAALGAAIAASCPEVQMAFLLGSSRDGRAEPGSDIDVAVLLEGPATIELYERLEQAVAAIAPGPWIDIGVLGLEPVFRFEALKGRLLFAREQESYLDFYSLTCRLYEAQMHDYARQLRYRAGAA